MLDTMKTTLAIGVLSASVSARLFDLQQYGNGNHTNATCLYKPLVNSTALQASIRAPALINGSQTLLNFAYSFPDRNRLMGGGGHNATVDYLVAQLSALDGYYTVETQAFSAWVHAGAQYSLFINGANTSAGVFDFTASGNVSGPIVVVPNGGCELTDYPNLTSSIALIKRGSCEFGLKSAYAGVSGAIGALIYDNIAAIGPLTGTLGVPGRPEGDYIPTLGLSLDQGTALATSIDAGTPATASLNVVSHDEYRVTHNVLATSNCGAKNTTLMLGAHTDSVAAGPGINDDGSGTIGILEVAKQLSKYRINNAVRFGFWSGEEEGDIGSNFYVDSLDTGEKESIRAYLNFDMIASPNFIHAIYDGDGSSFNLSGPAGSGEIEKFFEDYFVRAGENFTATEFDGRSDYAPFIDVGIPAGGSFTGAEQIKTEEEEAMFGGVAGEPTDANYHGAGDTVDNLDVGTFELHAKGIAAAVAEYTTTFESLPPKSLAKRGLAKGVGRRRKASKKGRKTAM